ncbi:calcineurin-like phosphoesterase domain-containing protein [Ditylenchus destructor]|uniref:Serine/threonine-protein phosphatase n=1 Tax=Ditylenchus destructor TaxID=166010 RepID=A0AAD4MP26_9BILA|nr:calcineurin-like phosphoesterase domain-containing protein [Ditylenchus destructor]
MTSAKANELNQLMMLCDRIILRINRTSSIEGFTEEEVLSVLSASCEVLRSLPAMINVDVPVTIFGDIHGQLADLQRFFALVGSPPQTKMLFLGDYVDRCNKGIEVTLLLLCYKLRYPARIDLLRGNHECAKLNRIYGFYKECRHKLSVKVWQAFQKVFDELPVCARVGKRILCMHGGLSPDIEDWDSLINLKKPRSLLECDRGIASDLMWSDPSCKSAKDSTEIYRPNVERGASYLFSDEAVKTFNGKMDLDLIVRAHEAVKPGHRFNANNQMCTIFSAPNYCGVDENSASIMGVSKDLEISLVTLKPKIDKDKMKGMNPLDIAQLLRQFEKDLAKSPRV